MNCHDSTNKAARKSSSKGKKVKKRTHSSSVLRYSMLGTLGIGIVALVIIVLPYVLTGSASAAIIKIPKGAGKHQVEDSLAKYFGNDFAGRTFKIFNALESRPYLRYGAYRIPEGSSPAAAARILARGAQTPVTLTINGVRDFPAFADRIAAKFEFSGDDLRNALKNPQTAAEYDLTPEEMPSLFMNDTYYLYWTSTPGELIKKVGDNYKKFWNSERREKAASLGLTPAQIMIIASIADEETNQLSEKGRIGRLYINRLNHGMKLQADPTVKFALKDFSIKRITRDHLQAPGPYNTYRNPGLPPGPIRTTSARTVDAILNSDPSDDFYMCAKEDFSGFHNFASTFEEHKENARRYQQALDSRGIR